MFGNLRSILMPFPYISLITRSRILRLALSGGLTGFYRWFVVRDLYDFYHIVIQRLSRDSRVPFRLEGTSRIDDTPIREAIREAFTNTLIHADYSVSVPIQIIKRPDMFRFRNPGTMRVPIADAVRGGLSDCRNRTLQMMFDLVGYGEPGRVGSSEDFPAVERATLATSRTYRKILARSDHPRPQNISLLPKETLKELEGRFGDRFSDLSYTQKLALATVAIEGEASHTRPVDVRYASP